MLLSERYRMRYRFWRSIMHSPEMLMWRMSLKTATSG